MIYSSLTYPSHFPLRPGIDFTGGTLLQYGFEKPLASSDISTIRNDLTKIGIDNPVIQIEERQQNFIK